MHRINYKGGGFDYIDSDRVEEIFQKLQKKAFFKVGKNIRDSYDVKNVLEVKEEDTMIYDLLKSQNNYTEKKVLEEIALYPYKITSKVVENMILKYK